MILKKSSFLKSTILKKKIFLQSRYWKVYCTQKITFWFILPRKMRKFCVFRAILKNTILKKKNILKSMILNKKLFLKSMILNKKFLWKAWFSINFFSSCRILDQNFFVLSDFESNFYNASDFKSTFWTRVRFWLKFFTARQILSVLLLQFGKFSCVHQNMSRFRNVLRYSVVSVSQVFCWDRLRVPQLWST